MNRGFFSFVLLLAITQWANAQSTGQPIIGVGQMVSTIQGADPESFQTMVETQLIETQKFRVIERARLDQILGEKALGQAGITNSGQTISGVTGVDYLVYGTITKLGQDTSGVAVGGATGFGRAFGHLGGVVGGGFATSQNHVIMAVDLRVADAHTGEIRYAGTVEEQIESGSATRVGGMAVGGNSADPLADVQRLTAKAIVALITTSIYPIRVITKEGDGTYVLNYGSSVLTVGDQLGVYQLGQSFKDPDTGKILGAEETQTGLLKVVDVEAQFSKAALVSGTAAADEVVKRISTADAKPVASRGPSLP
jgi:curli biogenesis system outer membrane secretion channel CsgG